MISLVIDPRDPALERTFTGSKYRPARVTVTTSRNVALTDGGFIWSSLPIDEPIPVDAPLVVQVPATDGAEIVAADRSTFVYVVTVTSSRQGKSREDRVVTFRGLLPTSLGATVQVTGLVNAEPLPAPFVTVEGFLADISEEVATEINTPGTPAHEAVLNVAGTNVPNIPTSKVTTGVFVPARLGTGTADATKVLFGDGTWKATPSVGPAPDPIEMVKLSQYCSGDGSNESGAFQDAVDECLATGATLLCDVRDPILLGSGVTLGDTRANGQQRIILTLIGALKLKALSAMDRLVTIRGTISTQACHMELDSSAGLAKFTIYAVNCGRMKLGHLHLFGGSTSNFFIEPTGNNNLWSATTIRSTGGGSKLVTNATLTARSAESGWTSTGDSAPYSTWTLSNPLPAALSVNEWAAPLVKFADGRFMQVRRVVDSTHIEVFNEDRPLSTAESVTVYGASLNWAYYGDTGGWEVGQIDVRDNPNAAALTYGGYGGTVASYYQQNNAVGIAILKKAHGLSIGQFYTELSGTWLICRDVLNTALFIGPGTNGAPTDFQIIQQGWMTMTGRNKQPLHWIVFKPSGSPIVAPPAIPIDVPELTPGARNVTPGTVQAYRRTSGNYALRIDNNYGSAVGLVVLAAPSAGAGTDVVFSLLNTGLGHTVMGGSTYTVKTFGPGTMFAFWLEPGTTPDWKVSPVGIPNDSAAAITSAPARVGQLATVAGVGYMATGTSSTADWKQITN